MSTQFQIGEIAILQHATFYHEFNSYPCVIVNEFRSRNTINLNTMEDEILDVYRVEILTPGNVVGSKDSVVSVQPYQLRKLINQDNSEYKSGTVTIKEKEKQSLVEEVSDATVA
jgi:hypothetical protein